MDKAKLEECQKEVEAVLSKHGCDFSLQWSIVIVPKKDDTNSASR